MTHSVQDNPPNAQIEVADLLQRLREEVRSRRQSLLAQNEQHDTYAALDQQLRHCAEQLELTRVVCAHWPLTGYTVPERAIALFNKLVRRYLRWYINPIVDQQNEFNDVTTRTLRLLIEAYGDLHNQMVTHQTHHNQPKGTEALSPNLSPFGRGASERAERADPPSPLGKRRQGVEGVLDQSDAKANTHDLPLNDVMDYTTLQAIIDQRGKIEHPTAFPDVLLRAAPRKLALYQTIQAHWQLEGDTRGQKLLIVIHKTVRYYLRWLINPIVEQQNHFQAAVVNTLSPIIQVDAEIRATMAHMRAKTAGSKNKRNIIG